MDRLCTNHNRETFTLCSGTALRAASVMICRWRATSGEAVWSSSPRYPPSDDDLAFLTAARSVSSWPQSSFLLQITKEDTEDSYHTDATVLLRMTVCEVPTFTVSCITKENIHTNNKREILFRHERTLDVDWGICRPRRALKTVAPVTQPTEVL